MEKQGRIAVTSPRGIALRVDHAAGVAQGSRRTRLVGRGHVHVGGVEEDEVDVCGGGDTPAAVVRLGSQWCACVNGGQPPMTY
jgi:hypothetical protein